MGVHRRHHVRADDQQVVIATGNGPAHQLELELVILHRPQAHPLALRPPPIIAQQDRARLRPRSQMQKAADGNGVVLIPVGQTVDVAPLGHHPTGNRLIRLVVDEDHATPGRAPGV
jgi:hypothetical protein